MSTPSAPSPASPGAPRGGTVGFVLRESFVPHTVVLIALIALTAWLDRKAMDWAQREVVVAVSAQEVGWDASQIQDDGMVAAGEGATEDPTLAIPALAEARRLSRANDHKAALAIAEPLAEAPGATPALWNEVGVYRLRSGDPAGAITALDRALAADGTYLRARLNRGLAKARAGDTTGARADYLAVLERSPQDFSATFNLGLLDLATGDAAAAQTRLEAAVGLAGNDGKASALSALGLALARLGRRADALAAYDKAIEFRPGYVLPRYNQVALLMRSNAPLDAQRASLLLSQLISLAPDFAPAHFLRGRLASQGGDRKGALEAYGEAARLDRRFFKAHYNFALVSLELDRVADAKAAFERLAREFPDRPEPHFNLGRIAYRQEQNKEAVAAYGRALELAGGDYPDARLNLALALDALGRFDEALAELARIEAHPELGPAAVLNQGLVKKHQGDMAAARRLFLAAIARRPGYVAALYNLGKLDAEQGDHKGAAEAYGKVLTLDPDNVKAAVNLGVERAALGDHQGAIAAYRSALGRSPAHTGALFNLALAQRAMGDLDGAASTYRRLIAADEDNVKAWQNLSVVYARQNRPDLAVEVLGEALDRDPSSKALRFNLARQYQKLGRAADAEAELRRVLGLDRRYTKAALTLARALRERGEHDAALAVLAPLTSGKKPLARALVATARVQLAAGRRAEALAALDQALDRSPTSVEALTLLVETGPSDAVAARLTAAETKDPKDPAWPRLRAALAARPATP